MLFCGNGLIPLILKFHQKGWAAENEKYNKMLLLTDLCLGTG